jgi:hypothetical protein
MSRVQPFEKSDSGFEGCGDVFGKHGFVGMMTDAAGAAQEQHRGGHTTRNDHGVVARAAGHFMERWEQTREAGVHGDGWLVEAWLPSNREPAARCDLPGAVSEFANRLAANVVIGMANIQAR